MDDDTARAILAALVDVSDDIKAAANAATSEHVRRGLLVADELLHARARSYAAGLVVEVPATSLEGVIEAATGLTVKIDNSCGCLREEGDISCPNHPALDDLARARERRELAGLPTVNVTVTESGLEMDFDLGEDPPKRR